MLSDEGKQTVPFSQRRHRLHDPEVPEATAGLRLRLIQHLKTRENLSAARIAFRAFYRLSTYCRGRPKYPSHDTWEEIIAFLNGTIAKEVGV